MWALSDINHEMLRLKRTQRFRQRCQLPRRLRDPVEAAPFLDNTFDVNSPFGLLHQPQRPGRYGKCYGIENQLADADK